MKRKQNVRKVAAEVKGLLLRREKCEVRDGAESSELLRVLFLFSSQEFNQKALGVAARRPVAEALPS